MIKEHFIRYFTGTILLKIMSVVSMPIIVRTLTVEEYAGYSLINTYFSILVVVLVLNFQSSISRFYFKDDDISEKVSSFLLLSIIYISFFLFVLYFFRIELSNSLELAVESVFFLVIAAYIQAIYNSLEEFFKVDEKSKMVSTLTVVGGAILYSCLLLFVFLFEDGSLSFITAKIISLIPIVFVFLYFFYRNLNSFKFSFKSLYSPFRYSISLIPYALSGFLLQQFDRVMLGYLDDLESVAFYSFSYSVGSLPYLLVGVILVSWNPSFMKCCNERNFFRLNSESNQFLLVVSAITSIAVLFNKEISLVVGGESYSETTVLTNLVLLSNLFIFSLTLYLWFLNFKFKVMWSSVFTISSLIFNVMLNLLLIPKYGALGAAIATLMSYLLLYLLLHIMISIRYSGQFEVGFIRILLCFSFLVLVSIVSFNTDLFIRFFITLLLLSFAFGKRKTLFKI
ncbi:oligosaccharide flippase family protein [Vibrio sp. S9_S30]|uniref:oligosaccharide flippase family protein n=1 Tax=Vibrio sp. S9_S30 TaxID=2720226 RepID=UPI0016803A75|nr:oligosaccharide flippase family protein [Vibrio sp. S9_S30]MBD1558469.1 oligosaccharide flippase family protein [Vibrio sp. S9_S30]